MLEVWEMAHRASTATACMASKRLEKSVASMPRVMRTPTPTGRHIASIFTDSPLGPTRHLHPTKQVYEENGAESESLYTRATSQHVAV